MKSEIVDYENQNIKFIYFVSLFIILLTIYGNSWLFGAQILESVVVYLICGLTLLCVFLSIDFGKSHLLVKSNLLTFNTLLISLMFLLFALSILLYNRLELKSLFNIFYDLTFVCYVYLYFYKIPQIFAKRRELFRNFLLFMSVLGTIIAFLGLLILVAGFSPVKLYMNTSHSIIVHPNFVVYLYVVSSLITYYYILTFQSNFSLAKRVYFRVSLVILILALLFTYGRGGYVGATLGFAILGSYYYRKKAIFLLPPFVAFMVYVVPSFFTSKGIGSFFSRFALLIPAYYMITASTERLMWGYGAFNNMEVYMMYKDLYNVTEQGISDPHNSYLRLIMMFGILFTSVLLFFVLKIIIECFIGLRHLKTREDKFFVVLLVSLSCSLFAMGLFDSGLVATVFFYSQTLLISTGMLFRFSKKRIPYLS